jgi:hypothetical protein
VRCTRFAIRGLNVMNPLDPNENLVPLSMSRRRALRVRQLLQIGARTLKPVLMRLQVRPCQELRDPCPCRQSHGRLGRLGTDPGRWKGVIH